MVVTQRLSDGGIKVKPTGPERGALAVAEALKTNTTLTQLDMGSNNLGTESGNAVATALATNSTLQDMNLSKNNLSDVSGQALAEMLQANCTLTAISLQGNQCGDATGNALAAALHTNTTLRTLNLKLPTEGKWHTFNEYLSGTSYKPDDTACNQICEATWVALFEAVSLHNQTLTTLGGVPDPLFQALRKDVVIEEFDLHNLVMSKACAIALAKCLPTAFDGVKVINVADVKKEPSTVNLSDLRGLWALGRGCSACSGIADGNEVRNGSDYASSNSSDDDPGTQDQRGHERNKRCLICNTQTAPAVKSCFSGTGLIRLADGYRSTVDRIERGSEVWTPDGTARVLCVLHTRTRGGQRKIPLFAMPGNGPLLSEGHLVHLDGAWQTVGSVGTSSGDVDEVYNFVLDRGHVVEVDGMWCATLLYDVDDRRGTRLMDSLQRAHGWDQGYVEDEDLRIATGELAWEGKILHGDRNPHRVEAHAAQASLIADICTSSRPLESALVVDLHRAAMAGSGLRSTFRCGPREAVIRTSPHYVCPPSSELPRLLDACCLALARACEAWAPCHAAALALWSLCYLHLFSDGNGRTARGLACAVLVRTGSVFLSPEQLHSFHAYFRERAVRRRYFEALQATTEVLSSITEPMDFPEEAFAPIAALISEAVAWTGGRVAAAC